MRVVVDIEAGGNDTWIAQLEQAAGRLVAKHGDHDQKSHGNWATGESEESSDSFVDMSVEDSGEVVAATPGSEPIVSAVRSGKGFEMDDLLTGVNGKTKGSIGDRVVVACPVEQVDGGRGAGCELAAGFANEALGNIVDMPGSVIALNEDSVPMLITDWREGTPVAQTGPGPDWLTASPEAQDEGVAMAAFDYIVGNVDRHFNNLLVDESTGHLISIDHSLTFGTAIGEEGSATEEPMWNNIRVLEAFNGALLGPELKGHIRDFIEDTEAQEKMAAVLDSGVGDGAARVSAAVDRAWELVNGGEIPEVEQYEGDFDNGPDWDATPPTETPYTTPGWVEGSSEWTPLPAHVSQWPPNEAWDPDMLERQAAARAAAISESTAPQPVAPGQQAIWPFEGWVRLAEDDTLVDQLRREQAAAMASQFGGG